MDKKKSEEEPNVRNSKQKHETQEEECNSYPLIENHGVIGNMKSLALVATCGTIDWFCFPHFDSPSIFSSILDDKNGGSFQIYPTKKESICNTKQMYSACTNILITRFYTANGLAQIADFMPVNLDQNKRDKMNLIVRKIICQSGTVSLYFRCKPAFDYGRSKHTATLESSNHITFKSDTFNMQLVTSINLDKGDIILDEGNNLPYVYKEFTIKEGDSVIFYITPEDEHHKVDEKVLQYEHHNKLLEDTRDYWLKWISQCTYKGRWLETVHRSALVLKLLTFEKTGAIIAAGTTSLPEYIGGTRNWDYRFTWIRDAAFTLYAFMRIGFTYEASQFMKFLEGICIKADELPEDVIKERGPLQIMYKIDGSSEIPEHILSHLSGYKDSKPVRIGNQAYNQMQLDIYGELLDSIYLYNKYGAPITYDFWVRISKMIDWVCDNWNQKDEGIWEIRAERQHFVYSKVMCWVAVDRALRLSERRSFPAPRAKWFEVRDKIYEQIMKYGWNEEKQYFGMYYGSDILDASITVMPLVFFLAPNDPRLTNSLNAILKSHKEGGLVKNESLVYRYDPSKADDGLGSEEGTFNICSFWLIEALTRVGRHYPDKMREAHKKFDEAISYCNHLGLYSEEIAVNGKFLGNFPQAFSHIALISCAYNLDRDLNRKQPAQI